MGLFDMFGAGGGSLSIQPTSPNVASGSAIAGNLVFMGGTRAQNVTKLTLRLTMEQRTMQMTNQGVQPQTQSRDVVPATTVAQMFSTSPGQPSSFPFQLPVPSGLPSSTPGSVTFHLRATADIDGEVDPGCSLEVQVVGTGPAATPGMPGGMPGMPGGMPGAVLIALGTHVMAQWTDGRLHPARVQAFENGMYRVDWDEAHLGASSYVHPQQIQMPAMHQAPQQQGMAHPPYAKHDPHSKQQHDPHSKQQHDPHAKGLGSVGHPPSIGSPVMAQHPNNHQWYPGRVAAMQNGMVGVDWDDPNLGQSTWVAPTAVRGR